MKLTIYTLLLGLLLSMPQALFCELVVVSSGFNSNGALHSKDYTSPSKTNRLSSQGFNINLGKSTLNNLANHIDILAHSISFYGQLKSIPSRQMNLRSVGISYSPFFAKSLSLSAGYMDIPLLSTTDSSITLGVGVDLGIIKINYAYETGDSLYYEGNASHYVSMGLNLGAKTK